MKKIRANNYSQAIKEVEALDKDQAQKVKEEIKHSDRKHNHVVVVKISDRPGEAKNEVNVNTIIVNDDKLAKLKKNFKFLGFAKLIILHDASQVEEDETPVLHLHDKEAIKAQAKKEMQAEFDAKFQERVKELEAQKLNTDDGGGSGDDVNPNQSKIDELENDYVTAMSGNKDELVSFMVKYEQSQEGITNNDQRKQSITAFYNTSIGELNGGSN